MRIYQHRRPSACLAKTGPARAAPWSPATKPPAGASAATSGKPPRGENLTLSVVWLPTFLAAGQQLLLSQAVALAVHDWATALLGPDPDPAREVAQRPVLWRPKAGRHPHRKQR
ncbi:MAG: hypothetical protein WKG07_20125 [Hymenobacter sp.]